MPDTQGPAFDPEERRQIGVALFNRVWTYLEMPDRTQEQDDLMVHMAHASRYNWEESGLGGPGNVARGEWQVSGVYAVDEALARASVVAADSEAARRHMDLARGARDGIAEDESREPLDADLATIGL